MSRQWSRRRFIETTIAGAASPWIVGGARAEGKTRDAAEPSNAGDLTALSLAEASDLVRRRKASRLFATVDVLVTPTIPAPAHLLAELGTDVATSMRLGAVYAHNTSPFNVYGIPSISVPCGFTANGLPIGLQISGSPGAEAVVLQVAAAYEKAAGWKPGAPPPV